MTGVENVIAKFFNRWLPREHVLSDSYLRCCIGIPMVKVFSLNLFKCVRFCATFCIEASKINLDYQLW
jgi:hypothetical protein